MLRNKLSLANYCLAIVLMMIFVAAESAVVNAQMTLGIYGGVNMSLRNAPQVAYVRLDDYPASEPGFHLKIPVNSIKNYSFYYDQNGYFVPGGGYTVSYLKSDGTAVSGISPDGPFTYSPNSGHTNGYQVRAPNSGGSGVPGIHGTIYSNGGDEIPLPGVRVKLCTYGTCYGWVTTNGNGYFNYYYDTSSEGDNQTIIPNSAHYNTTFVLAPCGSSGIYTDTLIWEDGDLQSLNIRDFINIANFCGV